MAEDTTELLEVRARVDRASFQQAEQVVKRFERSTLGGLGKSTADKLEQVYTRISRAASQSTRDIEAGNAALRERASLADDNEPRRGGRGGLRAAGSELLQAAGRIPGTGEIADLAATVAGLGPPALAATAAMAALSLAVSAAREQYRDAERAAQTAIAANQTYYETIGSLSREELRESIERLSRQAVLQQENADNLNRVLAGAFSEAQQQYFGVLGDAVARIQFSGLPVAGDRFNDLAEAARQANDELNATNALLARYEQALASNATALQDAIAANERAQAQFVDRLVAGAESIEQGALRVSEWENLSSEAARQRIERLNEEQAAVQASIEFLERWAGTNEAANAELEERRAQLAELQLQETELNQVLNTTITQREAETAALKRQTDARQAAKEALLREAERQKEARQTAAQAQGRIVEIEARAAADRERILANLADREAQAVEAERAEALKSQRDYARERAKIEKQSERGSLEAVGNRDALALLQARRSAEDARDELEASAREEAIVRSAALQKQVNEARRAANEQLNAARQRANTDIAAQRTLLASAQNSLNARVRLEQSGYTAMGNASVAFAQKLTQVAAAIGNLKVNMPAAQNTPTATSAGGVSDAALKGLARALRG